MRAIPFEIAAAVGMVIMLGAAIGIGVLDRPTMAERAAWARAEERMAREWADRVGISITGVECDGFGSCTIGRETGPVAVRCNRETGRCALEKP